MIQWYSECWLFTWIKKTYSVYCMFYENKHIGCYLVIKSTKLYIILYIIIILHTFIYLHVWRYIWNVLLKFANTAIDEIWIRRGNNNIEQYSVTNRTSFPCLFEYLKYDIKILLVSFVEYFTQWNSIFFAFVLIEKL